MIKEFLRDYSIYSFTGVLTTIISMLLIPFYTRVFVPKDYGIIDIITVVTTLVGYVITLEINQGVARFIMDTKNDDERIGYSSTAIIFTLCVYTIFAIAAILNSSWLSPIILSSPGQDDIFIIAICSIWAGGLFNILQSQLRWRLKSRNYAIVNVIYSLSSIVLTIILVLILQIGVIGVFYGLFFAGIIGSVLSYIYVSEDVKLVFDFEKLKEMLIFSMPFVPSSISVFLAAYVDRVAIKQLMTMADVGIYGVGFRFASIIGLLIGGVQMSMTPLIYNYYKEKSTPGHIANIFRYFLTLALILYLAIVIFSSEIMELFTTPAYYDAAKVMPLLVPAIALSGMYVFAPGVFIEKKTKTIAAINIFAAILNTVLNFLFIPIIGILGAALATLINSLTIFCIYQLYNRILYPIPYEWKKIYLSVGLTIVITIMLYAFTIVSSGFYLIVLKIILFILGLVIIPAILINKGEIRIIINDLKIFFGRKKGLENKIIGNS